MMKLYASRTHACFFAGRFSLMSLRRDERERTHYIFHSYFFFPIDTLLDILLSVCTPPVVFIDWRFSARLWPNPSTCMPTTRWGPIPPPRHTRTQNNPSTIPVNFSQYMIGCDMCYFLGQCGGRCKICEMYMRLPAAPTFRGCKGDERKCFDRISTEEM